MGDILNLRECTIEQLRDAGCSEGLIEQFLQRSQQEKPKEQMRLLRQFRAILLNEAHLANQRIDRLDILLYKLGKEAET